MVSSSSQRPCGRLVREPSRRCWRAAPFDGSQTRPPPPSDGGDGEPIAAQPGRSLLRMSPPRAESRPLPCSPPSGATSRGRSGRAARSGDRQGCVVDEVVDILGSVGATTRCWWAIPGSARPRWSRGWPNVSSPRRSAEASRLVVEFEMGALVAGTALRGSFSERLGAIKEEVRQGRRGGSSSSSTSSTPSSAPAPPARAAGTLPTS